MIVEINPSREIKEGDILIAKKVKGKIVLDYTSKEQLLEEENKRIHDIEIKVANQDNAIVDQTEKIERIQQDVTEKLNKIIKIVGDVQ